MRTAFLWQGLSSSKLPRYSFARVIDSKPWKPVPKETFGDVIADLCTVRRPGVQHLRPRVAAQAPDLSGVGSLFFHPNDTTSFVVFTCRAPASRPGRHTPSSEPVPARYKYNTPPPRSRSLFRYSFITPPTEPVTVFIATLIRYSYPPTEWSLILSRHSYPLSGAGP